MSLSPSLFRLAVRRIFRAPTFSIAVLVTLALGIGITTAVFALVYAVLLRPLPYAEAERLVAVGHGARGEIELADDGLSPGTLLHYREHSRSFEAMAGYIARGTMLTDDDAVPEQVRVARVSPDFFAVLGARPHLGRYFTTEESEPGSRPGVVISHSLWERRYGADQDLVGRTIEVNRRPEPVIGVMQPGFRFPNDDTDVWTAVTLPRTSAGIGGLHMGGIGRLRPGVTPERAVQDLNELVSTLPDAYPSLTRERLDEIGLYARVVPLREAIVGDVRLALTLLLAGAAFLLLITWANATNLTLVRAEGQRRDVAVEGALGAPHRAVARRFFAESLLLATAGGVLGLAVAWIAVRVRFGFTPDGIPRLEGAAFHGPVLLLAAGLIGASWMLLGIVSYLAAGRGWTDGMRGGSGARATSGRPEQMSRRVLVVGQVALALVLLIGAGLMAQSYWKLTQVKPGFEPEGAFTFALPVPPSAYRSYHESARLHHDLLERLRAVPGIHGVEVASGSVFPLTPAASYYQEPIAVDGGVITHGQEWPHALFGFASPGYFELMGIPILRGRAFRSEDMGPVSPGVILSEALAGALFPEEDPIGRNVRWAQSPALPAYTVVGVAGGIPAETMRDGNSRVIYFANVHPPAAAEVTGTLLDYIPSDEMYVARTSLPASTLFPAIRQAISDVDPKLIAVRPLTLEQVVAESMAQVRLTLLLLLVGAGAALVLGVVGIYGVLAYIVRRRTPEFAIRIALGAPPRGVAGDVVRQGMMLAALGIIIGILGGGILARALGKLLYGVAPDNIAAFAAAAFLLLAVSGVASWIPARRAARTPPAQVLRAE